jgi:hypothetical protein
MVYRLNHFFLMLLVPCAAMLLLSCGSGDGDGSGSPFAVAMPGGFVEKAGSAIRPRWSTGELHDFLPKGRGKFTFPAPYFTEAMRITTAEDCEGADCVRPVGYSYWRNMNNHVNSNEILIMLGLNRSRGGSGPTLFSYDKVTEEITNRGPIFAAGHRLSSASAIGWYFSATRPTTLYVNDGSKMLRYDVLTHDAQVLFDVSARFGADREVWQMSSSNDDLVHAATLRVKGTSTLLGCVVYLESSGQLLYYPKAGDFDECQVDKSGQFLMIFEQLDGHNGMDNRIINLATGDEDRYLNAPGAGTLGHHDLGFGYAVGHDRYSPLPNATITWNLAPVPTPGPANHIDYNWELVQAQHISHTNARPAVPKEQQYACGSNADRRTYAQNEILCFRLDGSLTQLVVAPVMTDLDASGGGGSPTGAGADYDKAPKGNLDVTGRYFIWTTNLGGNRLDAFIVKVPGQLL